MDDNFDIPVFYQDKEYLFKGTLLTYGYSYKIQVDVDGSIILFEPDEERNFRAIITPENTETSKKIDIELLKRISAAIKIILK